MRGRGVEVSETLFYFTGNFVEFSCKSKKISSQKKGRDLNYSRYHPDFGRQFLQTLITGVVTYTTRLSLLALPCVPDICSDAKFKIFLNLKELTADDSLSLTEKIFL